jgi:two-component system copper resistance phosphate regulon response regulator CusR
MRVLIVGGEKSVSGFLSRSLEGVGYRVECEETATAVLNRSGVYGADILIADDSLPDMSGLRFIERVRERRGSPPIILLGATSSIEDRVRCLNAGADDYLEKPLALIELQARMRSILRRTSPVQSYLRVGDLLLDCSRCRATRGGRYIHLSPKEFAIVEYLMRNSGKTLSRQMILEHIWERKPSKVTGVVDAYIRVLRAKLDQGHREKLIATVRGVGYRMRDVEEAEVRQVAKAV